MRVICLRIQLKMVNYCICKSIIFIDQLDYREYLLKFGIFLVVYTGHILLYGKLTNFFY
jgi:hypothetical protein